MNSLKKFIELIQETEFEVINSQSLNLEIKYSGDDKIYLGFPLPQGNYLTRNGILDPGFGSGPVNYKDIDIVRVLANPVKRDNPIPNKEYNITYMKLAKKVIANSNIRIHKNNIEWSRFK